MSAGKPLKLFSVRVSRVAYVLAESEADAADMEGEISRWEDPSIEVGSEHLGWTDDCLVYHHGEEEITLAEARANYPVAQES